LKNLAKYYNLLIHGKVVFKAHYISDDKGRICDVAIACLTPQIFSCLYEQTFEIAINSIIQDLEAQLIKTK
jgi:ribosome-associated translation inhibitor RaiA